jgi:fucose permease
MPLLLLAYLGFVSLGLPDGMLGVAWPHMRAELGEPVGAVGFVLLVATAAYLVSSVSAGFVIGRLGAGWLLAASTGLTAAALAGFGVAAALLALVAAGALLGAGSGAIDAGLNAYAARHFSARHLNWLHASFGFGATLGPLLATGVIAAGLSWRAGYGVAAAGQLLLATGFAITARSWRARQPADAGDGKAPRDHDPPARASQTLALPAMWRGAAAFAIYAGVEIGAGLWAYTLLTAGHRMAEQVAGPAVAGYWGMLFVGRLVVGAVVGRVGTHRVLTASMAGLVTGAVLVAMPAPPLAVAGLLLMGFAAAPVFPLLVSTTAERVGQGHADRVVGLQVGAAALGGTGLPAAIGVLIGWLSPAVLGPALLVLALALAALCRGPSRGGRATPHR